MIQNRQKDLEGILPAGFQQSLREHLQQDILAWWLRYAVDHEQGGFFSRIDNENKRDSAGARSVVMVSRFLWTYSAAARFFQDTKLLATAHHAYQTLCSCYFDREAGGVFWSVYPDGRVNVSKKQLYGHAFALYGLSEYAAALRDLYPPHLPESVPYGVRADNVITTALNLYKLIEEYAKDTEYGGYVEALSRDWQPVDDRKLSDKDIDCDKSMNTNLHIMEALATLYRVLPPDIAMRKDVAQSLGELVDVLCTKIVQPSLHLGRYFTADWSVIPAPVSFGHDIEATWLIQEALALLGDQVRISQFTPLVCDMAETALSEAHDSDSGLFYNEAHNGTIDRSSVWWCQAEALVGFCNAGTLTGDTRYFTAMVKTWQWIQAHHIDREYGEWYAELDPAGIPRRSEPKGGNWKTPYHNGRSVLELLQRLF